MNLNELKNEYGYGPEYKDSKFVLRLSKEFMKTRSKLCTKQDRTILSARATLARLQSNRFRQAGR